MVKWCKPAASGIRISTDAAVSCSSSTGLGFLGRNSEGLPIIVLVRRVVGTFSMEVAKALSILMAVEEALRWEFRPVD